MAGGELYRTLQRIGNFREAEVRFISAEISVALAFLHSNDVVYRDLKPENVMFDTHGHIRLIDFGLAKQQASQSLRSTTCGMSFVLCLFR